MRALIDDGPFLPEAALGAGLVDDVAYEDQVSDELRKASGGDDGPSPRAVVSGEQYGQVSLASLGLNRGPAHRASSTRPARSSTGRAASTR